jgi:hypothetical protein
MEITITKWTEYNPRKDLKSMPWFRVESDIGFSRKLFGIPAEGRWLWIFLLSSCAREQKESVTLEHDYIEHHTGISYEKIDEYLQHFKNKGLVQVANESDRITDESVPNITEQNEQNEQNEQAKASTELEKSNSRGAINELSGDSDIESILNSVSHTAQRTWIKSYGADWVKAETLKAIAWMEVNPQKKPKKNFGSFLGRWFARGWETHRKTIPSNRQSFAQQNQDNLLRIIQECENAN